MSMDTESVKNVYNTIAGHFDGTRHSVWNSVKEFLDKLPAGSRILDAGCGNGKNMLVRDDCSFKGIDISDELVRIAREKRLDVDTGDVRQLPYEDASFDAVISIAVIHHIYEKSDRIKAINEALRVTKPGGRVMLVVWSVSAYKPRRFKKIDDNNNYFVSWKRGDVTHQRFYHLYTEEALLDEIEKVTIPCHIKETFFEMDNNGAILIRKE